MSEHYHIVPWYNSEEWHRAFNEIADPLSSKECVLKLLLVWKARSPSLPSGIESTLSLLQVYVEDTKTDNVANDQLLRLAYSSAIMRFVNHMLDTETVKGTSLYQAAKSLGVPDWIVDLRHDTAHSNSLPSITLLREACAISLQWLQKNYWDKHKEYIQDYICGQKNVYNRDENKIAALMNFYLCLSICTHNKLKIKNLSEIPDLAMRDSIVNDAKELLHDHIDLSNLKTVSIMSIMNIMDSHSKRLLKVKDASTHVNKALLGEDSVFLSKELLYFFSASDFKYKKKLYSSYVQCFEVLLTFLHTNDLLLDFILALIKITQNDLSETFKAKLAALWVSEILVALKKSQSFLNKINRMTEDGKAKKKKDLKQLYHHWFPNNTGSTLMLDLQKPVPEDLQDINFVHPIIAKYNPYLTYFIRNLLDLLQPLLPDSVADRVCSLAKLISSPNQFPMASSSIIYTANDVKMAVDEVVIVDNDHGDDGENDGEDTKEPENQEQIVNSIWRLASKEHSWSTCPIGQVPWHHKVDNLISMETNQVEMK